MFRALLLLVSFAISSVAIPSIGLAQIDPLNPVPGGATGTNAICIQVGDLNSGAFVGLFAQTGSAAWEEKSMSRSGAFKFEERARSAETLELWDGTRSQAVQFDFARKRVRSAKSPTSGDWTDLYHMLNATDKEGAVDCLALASRLGTAAAGGAGGAGAGGRGPATVIQNITIRPGAAITIAPGTQLTATSGPPCPGQPGFFLCPNRFSCAPVGGVCCPGVGACAPGTFCDRFIANACIGPGDPRFCPGTGDPATGISLHCQVGSVCLPGNVCNP